MCPESVASGSVVDERRSHSFSTGLLSSPEAFFFFFFAARKKDNKTKSRAHIYTKAQAMFTEEDRRRVSNITYNAGRIHTHTGSRSANGKSITLNMHT